MNTREMIETLASKKLWTSPGGKTPYTTLYSAIPREINEKGKDARFVKTERGRFAANRAA
jgi:HB1, ASXL, restriction endonuclease HTH domain